MSTATNSTKLRANRIRLWISLMLIGVVLLSACQQAATPTAEPTAEPTAAPAATQTPEPPAATEPAEQPAPQDELAAELVGPLWLLLGYGDAGNPSVVEPGTSVTLEFADDGSLSGSGGCNNFFGSYELTGDQIAIGQLGSTMMACDKGMDQETAILAALQSAYKVAFTEQGRLEIFYEADAAFEKKLVYTQSQKSLTNTLWLLEAFGNPANPAAPEAGTMITAQFSPDGILSGMAGCNNYTTSFTAEDGRLEVEMPASTLRECTQGMQQEAAYLEALAAAESYSINGTTLEITYNGGQGVLRYTSRHLPLENVLWTLVTINGEVSRIGLVATTALFEPGSEPGKGAVGGTAMCNDYRGSYSLAEQALTIEGIEVSWVRCPETVMQAEATYVEIMEAAQSYQVFGETLVITSEKGILTFSANRTPLEGTNWRLVTMGDIQSPTVPSQGGDFTARFLPPEGGPSGLVVGSTGCNDYNAAYLANLNELKVNLPNKTNNASCPASFWEQEQQFFLGLNAASTYRILGNTLQIPYDEGRQALTFTAFVPQVTPPPSGGPLTPLNGTSWWLTMISGTPVIAGTETTAQFAINADGQTGTISGSAGCNTYNAPITGVLQIGPAAVTKLFCAEPAGLMDQESQYLAALQVANSFTLAYNQLLINTRNGWLVYYNSPAPLQPIATPELPPVETEEPTETPTDVPAETPTAQYTPTAAPTDTPAPVAPVAVITAPTQGDTTQKIQFDASYSTSGGSITAYAWDFGDGTKGSNVKTSHQFTKAGTYIVTLTITDSNKKTATTTHIITIK